MDADKLLKWLEVGLYAFLLGGMLLASDEAPLRTRFYFYGMRGMHRVTMLSRKVEVHLMEEYFREVSQ